MRIDELLRTPVGADLSAFGGCSAILSNKVKSIITPSWLDYSTLSFADEFIY